MHPVAHCLTFSSDVTRPNKKLPGFIPESNNQYLLGRLFSFPVGAPIKNKYARHHRSEELKLALLASQSIHKHTNKANFLLNY